MLNWYLEVLKKSFVYNGRARRKEFWMFILFNSLISFAIIFIEEIITKSSNRIIFAIYTLAICVPTIAVGVRRMHDSNHNGWWLLFPIMNYVLLFTEGTKGKNRFGANPKAVSKTAKFNNNAGLS